MSLDFIYLNEIRKLESQAQELESSGNAEEAKKIYLKIASLYEKLAEDSVSSQAKELYLDKASYYRRKANPPVRKVQVEGGGGSSQEEEDFRSVALSMIEKSTVSWDDISGLDNVKMILKESIGLARAKPDKPVKLDPPRSILLFGPPGNGKTMLASAASNAIKATFFNADISKILSKYVGDSPKILDALFSLAREKSPSIIFFDEIDSIALSREEEQHSATGLLQKLLTEMDGFKKSKEFVMIIAATNRPWALDEAVLSRFDFRIYVPLPDFEARKGIFKLELEKKGFEVEVSYDELAKMTEGYSGREISHICRKAIMYMIRRVNPGIDDKAEKIKIDKIRRDEIIKAIQETRPSVSKDLIKKYEEWYKEHGSS